jgi:hypothetical protein
MQKCTGNQKRAPCNREKNQRNFLCFHVKKPQKFFITIDQRYNKRSAPIETGMTQRA